MIKIRPPQLKFKDEIQFLVKLAALQSVHVYYQQIKRNWPTQTIVNSLCLSSSVSNVHTSSGLDFNVKIDNGAHHYNN